MVSFKKTIHYIYVEEFIYLGIIPKDQNFIHKEIKSTLNLANTCYHSVQNHLVPLLSEYVKTKIYKSIVFSVVLFGYKT
jgi:hypothetical protein